MPKRTDIKSILLIGSGPIIIGQACEFDYSGTQAVKALKEEGYTVILANSNPATIMTDPEFAHRTYIEPIRAEAVAEIIKTERPDAVLPTMGGQTALNVTLELAEAGIFKKYGCELIGANVEAIKTAEDRELFRRAMDEIGLESARSGLARSIQDAGEIAKKIGYPLILRPSRTLGGTGGGIVKCAEELVPKVAQALSASPNREVLIEESLLGWKEIELEVMRDSSDNAVVVCTIENLDPMGVHTGDSITVAPIQTLTDKEYQRLREGALKVLRRIGVDTGGSNVQFALNPRDGRLIVIEMNPRVSRSSALASKATGFPIAKIAAKLAVGYTLDEIPNDITKQTPACFEPSIDYVVVKIPRFNFEKFPLADETLGTMMKSVGEVMSFGRTFREALQKAMCSMELGSNGFDVGQQLSDVGTKELEDLCRTPSAKRLWYVGEALRRGVTTSDLYQLSGIDPWFLSEIHALILKEQGLSKISLNKLGLDEMLHLKREGFSDARAATLLNCSEADFEKRRKELGVEPSYKSVDTCAGEFIAHTPYLYSTYDQASDAPPTDKKKIIILGSGPNRIGQGIEFDYCCVHAVMAFHDLGFESVMVNCNPETVSTDYDVSDRLYFEPLTFESVMAIIEREKPFGVVVQFGGQTPLKLAEKLHKRGVRILGTSVDSIDIAEDRERFTKLVQRLKLRQPEFAVASSLEQALKEAARIGFPLMMRPSFVLGGRAMRVIHCVEDIHSYVHECVAVSNDRPVLMDRFLENAIEVDVDAVCDGTDVLIAGVMEHIERAGVHSGDSSCCLPPPTLSSAVVDELKRETCLLATELKVIGLINIQFAVLKDGTVYVLEVNPRASRTVPFVSKATGIPWAKVASRLMAGQSIQSLKLKESEPSRFYCVKASVFPFNRFAGVDTILGPEMKSTGEVMGLAQSFAAAFAKSQFAAGNILPKSGKVFLSVKDADKEELIHVSRKLCALGFSLCATKGTAEFLTTHGIKVESVKKVREGSPHIVDLLGEGKVTLVINTPEGSGTLLDSRSIRLVASQLNIPTLTTIAAATAVADAIEIVKMTDWLTVKPLQGYYARS